VGVEPPHPVLHPSGYRYKYLRTIKPKTQNTVLPAKRATQYFGFNYEHLLTLALISLPGSAGWCLGWDSASWTRKSWRGRASGSL